jgi:hypothetical protein
MITHLPGARIGLCFLAMHGQALHNMGDGRSTESALHAQPLACILHMMQPAAGEAGQDAY